jgi:hypothetical protein
MAWAGFPLFLQVLTRCYGSRCGGVSNVDIDGNNTLHVKAIGVVISTFETLPSALIENPLFSWVTPRRNALQIVMF